MQRFFSGASQNRDPGFLGVASKLGPGSAAHTPRRATQPHSSRAIPGSAGTKRTSTNCLRSNPASVLTSRTKVWVP
jgi:hypothetical protein